jgi:hypothetical protein
MPVLQARHASDVLIIVQIVCVKHLLYWFDSSCEEAATSRMLPFAVLAEATAVILAFADNVSPLIALIADCALRASLGYVVY